MPHQTASEQKETRNERPHASIPLVLYARVSDTSVGYLFLGGVVPGLLLGVVRSALIAAVAKRRHFLVLFLPRLLGCKS